MQILGKVWKDRNGSWVVGGMVATMTIEAPTDAEIFLAYIEHVLCPALKPCDMVVSCLSLAQAFSMGFRSGE
jgi:hypothetical protein